MEGFVVDIIRDFIIFEIDIIKSLINNVDIIWKEEIVDNIFVFIDIFKGCVNYVNVIGVDVLVLKEEDKVFSEKIIEVFGWLVILLIIFVIGYSEFLFGIFGKFIGFFVFKL